MPPKSLHHLSCIIPTFKIILASLDLRDLTLRCILKSPFCRKNHHSVPERGNCHMKVSFPSSLFIFVFFLSAVGRDQGLRAASMELKMTFPSKLPSEEHKELLRLEEERSLWLKARPHIWEFVQIKNCATSST